MNHSALRLRRLWTAWSADGLVVARGEGIRFVPPREAARVRVEIGRQIVIEGQL